MEKEEKKYVDEYVCEQCGRVHAVESDAPENPADQWKLVGMAAAGVCLLLLLWVWVFKYGVPLVKHIKSIE